MVCLHDEEALATKIVANEIENTRGLKHQFSRRWESTLLHMLLLESQAGRALTCSALQLHLRHKGQAKDLNRAQLQRLFDSLQAFLSQLPYKPLKLETAPRQTTVGPWRLVFVKPVEFQNLEVHTQDQNDIENGISAIPQPSSTEWLYPSLFSVDGEPSVAQLIDRLHQLLSTILIADAFALNGDYVEAIDTVQDVYEDKSTDLLPLTPETHSLVALREALWQKRLGHFDLARRLATQVIELAPRLDPGLGFYASFFLQRIDYDESPAKNHIHLWHSASAPVHSLQTDWRMTPEWHNLRGLLCRRRLLDMVKQVPNQKNKAIYVAQHETPVKLHLLAIKHFESALYWGLQQRNWDQLQAFAANIAFHLQEMLPLGLSSVPQVYAWHRLILVYADKLALAQDSAWEFIFFAEFWLNHCNDDLLSIESTQTLSHTIDDMTPAHEAFYLKGLDKLKQCADARQVATMWLLYGRFVREHLLSDKHQSNIHHSDSPKLSQNLRIKHDLSLLFIEQGLRLIFEENPKIRSVLIEEGYRAYIP